MRFIDILFGRSGPSSSNEDRRALATELGHGRRRPSCLAWRQGQCPDDAGCVDCPWAEGTSRETRGGRSAAGSE